MLDELSKFKLEHTNKIELAYRNSEMIGIKADKFPYRELSDSDLNIIYKAIDDVFAFTGEKYGMCFIVHSDLKQLLDKSGIKSELVIGCLKVNGKSFIKCDIEYIKEQWEAGFQNGDLNVHCWLLLEDGTYLDVTAYKDALETYKGCDMRGIHIMNINGNRFEFNPVVLGLDFILKTSIDPQ